MISDLLGTDFTVANIFGLIGFALIVLWPLLRSRTTLLAGQGASAASFAIHYLLIGAVTGAAMCGLSVLQVAAAWTEQRRWWQRAVYIATMPVLAALSAATWAGWPSACAAAGMALATAARWQRSTAAIRSLFLLAGVCWIAHDLLTRSLFGLGADVLGMLTLIIGAWRDRMNGANPDPSKTPGTPP